MSSGREVILAKLFASQYAIMGGYFQGFTVFCWAGLNFVVYEEFHPQLHMWDDFISESPFFSCIS